MGLTDSNSVQKFRVNSYVNIFQLQLFRLLHVSLHEVVSFQ